MNEVNLTVHVLFRSSKKTGKVDTTMIGLGKAMLELWAIHAVKNGIISKHFHGIHYALIAEIRKLSVVSLFLYPIDYPLDVDKLFHDL